MFYRHIKWIFRLAYASNLIENSACCFYKVNGSVFYELTGITNRTFFTTKQAYSSSVTCITQYNTWCCTSCAKPFTYGSNITRTFSIASAVSCTDSTCPMHSTQRIRSRSCQKVSFEQLLEETRREGNWRNVSRNCFWDSTTETPPIDLATPSQS